MTLQKQDWKKLQFSMISLVAAIIIVAGLVFYTMQLSEASNSNLQTQEGLLSQARQKYQSAGTEKTTINQYLPQYQSLIKQGYIGEEKRIEWIDKLRTIHEQNKMFSIDYSVEKQEAFTPSFALNIGSLKLRKSTMKIQLNMLHEGDIITLLDALKNQQPTPFIVRSCVISQNTDTIEAKLNANLLADCELDWLTLAEPATVAGVLP